MTKKTLFTRTALSMTLGISLALTAANAGQRDLILGEYVHDYSDDASRYLSASPSRQNQSGYNVRVVLDEAYYDFSDTNTAASAMREAGPERAEFAAFEESASGMQSKRSSYGIPWVSSTD